MNYLNAKNTFQWNNFTTWIAVPSLSPHQHQQKKCNCHIQYTVFYWNIQHGSFTTHKVCIHWGIPWQPQGSGHQWRSGREKLIFDWFSYQCWMQPPLAVKQCFARCVNSCIWSNNKTKEMTLLCKYDVVHKPTVDSFCQFLLWQPTREREVLAQIVETSKKFVAIKGHYFDDK